MAYLNWLGLIRELVRLSPNHNAQLMTMMNALPVSWSVYAAAVITIETMFCCGSYACALQESAMSHTCPV